MVQVELEEDFKIEKKWTPKIYRKSRNKMGGIPTLTHINNRNRNLNENIHYRTYIIYFIYLLL